MFEDGDTIKNIRKNSLMGYGKKFFIIQHSYSNNIERARNSYEYYNELGKFIGFDYMVPITCFVSSRTLLIERSYKYPNHNV